MKPLDSYRDVICPEMDIEDDEQMKTEIENFTPDWVAVFSALSPAAMTELTALALDEESLTLTGTKDDQVTQIIELTQAKDYALETFTNALNDGDPISDQLHMAELMINLACQFLQETEVTEYAGEELDEYVAYPAQVIINKLQLTVTNHSKAA